VINVREFLFKIKIKQEIRGIGGRASMHMALSEKRQKTITLFRKLLRFFYINVKLYLTFTENVQKKLFSRLK